MAAKAEDTTFGDILGYQYINSGEFYKTKTSTPDLSMSDILKELLVFTLIFIFIFEP
jgi:hypothetical protein